MLSLHMSLPALQHATAASELCVPCIEHIIMHALLQRLACSLLLTKWRLTNIKPYRKQHSGGFMGWMQAWPTKCTHGLKHT